MHAHLHGLNDFTLFVEVCAWRGLMFPGVAQGTGRT